MGVFDKFERRLEGAINGVFARTFKGAVHPVEIAQRLQRELDAEAKLLSRGKKLVPNDFTIGLSRRDYDRLAPYAKQINTEIMSELRAHAAERGFVFNGPIAIHYRAHAELSTGRFTVTSAAVADVEREHGADDAPVVDAADLVIEVNGIRHPLAPPGLVIGRGTDADLRINDPGISRRHAEIIVTDDASGNRTIEITDLGSTNGIIINGKKVAHAELTAGSRIEIGTTRLLVHASTGG